MAAGTALVAGATGMVGSRIVERLAEDGWRVIALSRRPREKGAGSVVNVAVDLLDREACRSALGELRDVTHIFYAGRAPHGEGGEESVADNMAMLTNLVETMEDVAAGLRHVHLVHGAKYYGSHLGRYKTPAKEDDPRHMPPNFYFDQQDYVAARAGQWTWTISRPSLVYEFAPEQPRNLVPLIGVYAAISRELGLPLTFPGKPGNFVALNECTDARHLAKAIVWMATEERCANQVFNATNGDAFRWEHLWPRFAAYFGMNPGPVRPLPLARFMADKGPVWERVVARHGLEPTPYERMAVWPYGDFVFGSDWDLFSDTTKLRRYGFPEAIDSEAMIFAHLDRYREAGLIP